LGGKPWKETSFMFSSEEVERFGLDRRPVILELKKDVNYGPYVAIGVERAGGEELIGTDIWMEEMGLGDNMRVDLNCLAMIDEALGRKSFNGDPLVLKPYRHPDPVPEDGEIELWAGSGRETMIRGLNTAGLAGKKVVFRPQTDPAYGWLVKVHDAEEYDEDLSRKPDLYLVRDVVRKEWVPGPEAIPAIRRCPRNRSYVHSIYGKDLMRR